MHGARAGDVALKRVAVAGAAGLVTTVLLLVAGLVALAVMMGGLVSAAVFLGWNWWSVSSKSAAETAAHVTRDDPTRVVTEVALLGASVGSLGGVALLVYGARSPGGEPQIAIDLLGVCNVAAAWLVVHTVYTMRYALLYYTAPEGGIDFNQDEPPAYMDFAYFSFTLGMTYQVSDTDVRAPNIRATVLRHGLLSYFLGAVVLASTINLVVALGTKG